MKHLIFSAIVALGLSVLAGSSQAEGLDQFIRHACDKTVLSCDGDDRTDSRKLNGKAGQAAAMATVGTDFRIIEAPGPDGKPQRLTLWGDWATNDFGGPGAAGAGASVHVPELADNLYFHVGGSRSFEGQGSVFKVGVTYAFSPF